MHGQIDLREDIRALAPIAEREILEPDLSGMTREWLSGFCQTLSFKWQTENILNPLGCGVRLAHKVAQLCHRCHRLACVHESYYDDYEVRGVDALTKDEPGRDDGNQAESDQQHGFDHRLRDQPQSLYPQALLANGGIEVIIPLALPILGAVQLDEG